MNHTHSARPASSLSARRSGRTIVALFVVIPALVALPIWSFAWAAANSEPHDLPVGVAGPAAATSPLEDRLAQHGDAFDVHTYDNGDTARTAVEDRDVYGAVLATPDGMTLLTASAASPVVAQLLTEAFASPTNGDRSQSNDDRPPVTVTDVVPADADDPHGVALGASVLPLVIVSVLSGVLLLALTAPGWGQLLGVLTVSVLGGAIAIGIVQGWLGVLGGDWVANASVVALVIGSIAACVVGFTAALGRAGLALAAPALIFLGNPWSGMTSAPELLPEPAGLIGQLLPPGAGGNLLRSTAFFDGAGATPYVLVLSAWTVLGVCAILVGAARRRNTTAVLAHVARPLATATR